MTRPDASRYGRLLVDALFTGPIKDALHAQPRATKRRVDKEDSRSSTLTFDLGGTP